MQQKEFSITPMQKNDVEALTKLRLQSWIDTYTNEDAGVTREWIEERNKLQLTPEKVAFRKSLLDNPKAAGFIAKDADGKLIGGATPYEDGEGVQHVGSLYVAKQWHGKGVGGALMQEIVNWSNPKKPIILGVVTYNGRAKAFYRKWGFKEIEGSETLFDNKVPEIMMERKGDKQ